MRVASSLTNRVFVACTLLAVLSIGFAFYFVDERASNEAEVDLRRWLLEAGTLLDQYGATRTDHFTRLARVVADLPKLKAAFGVEKRAGGHASRSMSRTDSARRWDRSRAEAPATMIGTSGFTS